MGCSGFVEDLDPPRMLVEALRGDPCLHDLVGVAVAGGAGCFGAFVDGCVGKEGGAFDVVDANLLADFRLFAFAAGVVQEWRAEEGHDPLALIPGHCKGVLEELDFGLAEEGPGEVEEPSLFAVFGVAVDVRLQVVDVANPS